MRKTYSDSHRTFKPYDLVQAEGETAREFDRRCDREYHRLVNEKETPANGNRVYMSLIKED